MGGGIPGMSLSTGPAISGGPTSSGPASTGDFYVDRRSAAQSLANSAPMIILGLAAIWLLTRR